MWQLLLKHSNGNTCFLEGASIKVIEWSFTSLVCSAKLIFVILFAQTNFGGQEILQPKVILRQPIIIICESCTLVCVRIAICVDFKNLSLCVGLYNWVSAQCTVGQKCFQLLHLLLEINFADSSPFYIDCEEKFTYLANFTLFSGISDHYQVWQSWQPSKKQFVCFTFWICIDLAVGRLFVNWSNWIDNTV